jgi:kinase-associated protein B
MSIITVGDRVRASYKSGEYIGEVVELTERKASVKVLAVLKHPVQGDLHYPLKADVAFFHQRKALAYREVVMVPLPVVVFFTGEVPAYEDSLRRAWEAEVRAVSGQSEYAARALQELQELRKNYFFG